MTVNTNTSPLLASQGAVTLSVNGQVILINVLGYAVATGTDTYAATITGVEAYTAGDGYLIKFTNANTGASTLNINTIGAIALKKSGTTALSSGDISGSQIMLCVFDGTNFQVIGGGGGSGGVTSLDGQTGALTLGGIINTLTGKTTPVDWDYTVIMDSEAGNASKKLSWENIKATAYASPSLTGTPTAPTAATGTNTTQVATTAFVQQEIGDELEFALVNSIYSMTQ